MNSLERFLAVSDSHRRVVYAMAAFLVAVIAYIDSQYVEVSLGFLYVIPILMASPTLGGWLIIAIAVGCSILRERFSPLHATPGVALRVSLAAGGFFLAGYFVSQLNRKRQKEVRQIGELERQMQLRFDAEQQLRVVIETSPLAILTLDSEGRVLLANESVQHLFHRDGQPLTGGEIQAYLPILKRFLKVSRSSVNLRTTVESRGQRADGDSFLAHLWLSTFDTNSGPCLAVFIWDASENLRDREGTGLDAIIKTSRIAVGAVSHEIRNLAAAGSLAHKQLLAVSGILQEESFQTLGTIIEGLEKIAASGLALASHNARTIADLGMVLDETRVVIDASFRDVGAVIHWKIADDLPLVQADQHSLLQVFLNLARNSHSAILDTHERMLSVEACVEQDMVIVRFEDTGHGIANPEALFKPFKSGASSTGLGLYISRAVLRSYGGDLYYEPNPKRTCFVVQLWPSDSAAEFGVL